MAEPIKKLPKLTFEQYEKALRKYFKSLEEQAEKSEDFMERAAGGAFLWEDTVAQHYDRLFNDYMVMAEEQGIGEWLPDYEAVLAIGAPEKLEFVYGENYKANIASWEKDVAKTIAEGYDTWEAKQKFELDKAKFGLSQQQFGFQQQQAEQEASWRRSQSATDWARFETERQDQQAYMKAQIEQEFANRETARMSALLGTGRDMGIPPEQYEKFGMLFNQWRQQYIGTLDPNLDWIKIQEIENAPNPYQPRETNFKDEMDFVRGELKNVRDVVKDEETSKKELDTDWTSTQERNLQLAKDVRGRLIDRLEGAEEQFLGEEARYTISEPTMMGGRMVQPAVPGAVGMGGTGPAFGEKPKQILTPEWLSKATGQVRGQPLQKGEFTPSSQWMIQTAPATRSRMAGWQEWSEPGAYQESLSRMQTMLPRQPVRPTWRAAGQRI